MKNVLAISVFFCSSLGLAAAQTGTFMTVNLPNATMVGSTSLPAGEYTVREIESNGNGAILQFGNATGTKATVFAQQIPSDVTRSEVTLKSDGAHLQLDKIFLAERDYGFQVAK
jgi:hypothetical protein